MKKTLLSIAALTLLASGAQARTWEAIKQSGTIKIGTEGAFPPFNVQKGKELSGFEVELAEALAKQLGLKVQWVVQPFDGLLIGLQQDRFDFVIASHGITPERAKAVDFANPHYCTGGTIVSMKGGPKTAADLKGKVVAVQVGTTYLSGVQKLPGVKPLVFPKDTDAQTALMTGRAAAWVGDKFTGLDLVKAQKGKLQQGDMLFSERIGMAVKKGNSGLLKELNAALAKALSNGTYAKISSKYFGQDIRCK
ncbi:ABC transporter substrate-binding protein [Deinococcus aquaedulcis]|uniref:ABC transporter substrate-binding protein n=1 Tax=Deinococcus aquaedulcis TaxID=2840455 RepID=UPI001C832242|nr:ABC transporter substrate-binding protein [Deinococcus aquaedulcis]